MIDHEIFEVDSQNYSTSVVIVLPMQAVGLMKHCVFMYLLDGERITWCLQHAVIQILMKEVTVELLCTPVVTKISFPSRGRPLSCLVITHGDHNSIPLDISVVMVCSIL